MQASSRWLAPLLGFLTAVGPLSTDMYLPAFPAIEASYGAPEGTAQITLASWFAGLAVGQIAQGTMADRMGRRVPLMAGLALYTLASAGCALAPTLATLTIMRAVAAFGGSASMVLPRAIVRDLADGHAAARLMSQLMLVMGVAPILLGMSTLGFIMPNTAVGALSRHAAHAGSASALLGTIQFLFAAISGVLMGWLTDGTARPLAAMMLLGAVLATIADACRRA